LSSTRKRIGIVIDPRRYTMTEHTVAVPLDHARPDGETIDVFARELCDVEKVGEDLPWLLFLQGGPGGASPRPSHPDAWIRAALASYRLLLLDQRGTGRSTPVLAHTADRFQTPKALADYLAHFRADAIVGDAEILREEVCHRAQWSTLGQSYGGFITVTYLSRVPEALQACYVTGGLPGLTASADDVYALTYPKVVRRVADYYARYPADRAIVRTVADILGAHNIRLPDGDRLTVRRLQYLGQRLGMSDGFEFVHWLFERALVDGRLTDAFRYEVMAATGFLDNPLYAVLQEPIYARGYGATAWAAQRILREFPLFAPDRDPLLFTGEMIYPWMFEEITALRPFAEAANILAERDNWAPPFDPDRLAGNEVPVAAVIYHDDIYVPVELSLRTAAAIGNLRPWVTSEWEHDGIRSSGDEVFARLRELASGVV
jgi:pimeloyl-ACP methyl ester carboxylesterase